MYLRIQPEEPQNSSTFTYTNKNKYTNKNTYPNTHTQIHAHTQEEQARKLMPWFESIGLPRQDAMDVALACVRQKVYCALSLCTLPEEDLCKALRPLPPGLWCYMPMIIQAVRVCKTARQAATPTALRATVKDWMRDAGLNKAMAEAVGLVLSAEGMTSKGLVMTQEQDELELVARKMPATAMHAFLATVQDARNQQQFTLGLPPRLIQDKWAAPVKPFIDQFGTFDDATVHKIETACGNDNLKIRCIFGLLATEDSELSKALTAANLSPIVQKALINKIQNVADRSDTQWVVDTESPGELGQLTIYTRRDWDAHVQRKAEEEERKRKEEVERLRQAEEERKRLAAEAETYEPTGCCGLAGKCRKCGKPRTQHFTPALYCIDSRTRGALAQGLSQPAGSTKGGAKVTPVNDDEGAASAAEEAAKQDANILKSQYIVDIQRKCIRILTFENIFQGGRSCFQGSSERCLDRAADRSCHNQSSWNAYVRHR